LTDKDAEKLAKQGKAETLVSAPDQSTPTATDDRSPIEIKVAPAEPVRALVRPIQAQEVPTGGSGQNTEQPSSPLPWSTVERSVSTPAETPRPKFNGTNRVPNPLLQGFLCLVLAILVETFLGRVLGFDSSRDYWRQRLLARLFGLCTFYLSYSVCWSSWPEKIIRELNNLTGTQFSGWSGLRRLQLTYPPFLWLAILTLIVVLNPTTAFPTPFTEDQPFNSIARQLVLLFELIHLILFVIAQVIFCKALKRALVALSAQTGNKLPLLFSPFTNFVILVAMPTVTIPFFLSNAIFGLLTSAVAIVHVFWYQCLTRMLKRESREIIQRTLENADTANDRVLQYRPFAAMERWWKQRLATRSIWKTGFIGVILLTGGYVAIEHPTALADGFAALIMAINTGKLTGIGATGTQTASDAGLNFAFIQFISWAILFVSGTVLIKGIKAARGLAVGENGVRYVYGRLNRQQDPYLAWSEISRIEIERPTGKTTTFDDRLILYRTSGKPFTIAVGSLPNGEDKEALLAAFDKYAPTVPRSSNVIEVLTTNIDNSYTELWLQALAAPPKRERLKPMVSGAKLNNERYEIIRELGVGGQGFAYLAQDNANDNPSNPQIVLKEFVLPVFVDINARKQALDRFEKEARLLTRLEHPQVVKLTGFFVEDHRAYLALEHIDGENLRQLVTREGALPEERVRGLAAQMAEILTYLHGLRPALVHRDFTPDNLILNRDGQLKLIDFNVAHEVESTTTGTVVGKQAYLPPEQFRGQPTTKSDLYAMGATLYFLLTGKDPVPISMSSPLDDGVNISAELDHLVKNLTAIEESERPDATQVTALLG
jgi:hypothetical protein